MGIPLAPKRALLAVVLAGFVVFGGGQSTVDAQTPEQRCEGLSYNQLIAAACAIPAECANRQDPDAPCGQITEAPSDDTADIGDTGTTTDATGTDPEDSPSSLPIVAAVAACTCVGGAFWIAGRRMRSDPI